MPLTAGSTAARCWLWSTERRRWTTRTRRRPQGLRRSRPRRMRMRLRIGAEQGRGVDLRIALGGAERGVPEEFLDGAQVGAGAQQVRGERVAQRMRRGAGRQA